MTTVNTYTFKILVVNIFLLCLVTVGLFYGILTPLFTNDESHITYFLGVTVIGFVVLQIRNVYNKEKNNITGKTDVDDWLNFIRGKYLFIGLLGTIIGFRLITEGLNEVIGMTNMDVVTVLKATVGGLKTLWNTTIVGIVSFLWISLNIQIVKKQK